MVITDIEMPVMSGLQLSHKIKERTTQIPIVVVSAYTDADYFLDAIEYGIDYYVLKPINTNKLIETLYRACIQIQERQNAALFQAQELLHKIEIEKMNLLETMSNNSPNPMVLYRDNRLEFFNRRFAILFLESDTGVIKRCEELIRFIESLIVTDETLSKAKGLSTTIDFAHDEHPSVALRTKEGKRAFALHRTYMEADALVLYTFNDITTLLYQTIQLEEYHRKFESMVRENFTPKEGKNPSIIDKVKFD